MGYDEGIEDFSVFDEQEKKTPQKPKPMSFVKDIVENVIFVRFGNDAVKR